MPSSWRRAHAVASRSPNARNNTITGSHGKMPVVFAEGAPQSNSTASEGWRTPVGASGGGGTTSDRIRLPSVARRLATADLVARLYRAGDEVRPYRPQDVACAAGAFLHSMSSGQPLRLRFEAFASELQADEHERFTAAATIGLLLPRERDARNANEQVKYALASRSLLRRAGKMKARTW